LWVSRICPVVFAFDRRVYGHLLGGDKRFLMGALRRFPW